MKFINSVLTLAALAAPAVRAQSTAAVVNMCTFPVYIWSVSNVQSPMVALPNSTVGYQEPYHNKPDGSGVSIKIAPTFINENEINMSENITQFEYTLDTNQVWYDISYVNGNAFQGIPVLLQPSDSSCPNVTCAASDSVCKEMYNNPNDNLATHVCKSDADLFFLLCPPSSDGSSNGSGSSTSSTSTSSSNGGSKAENVVVGANGNAELSTVAQTADQAISTSALNSLTSLDDLRGTVNHWISYSAPSKRDEEVSKRHSHREFHERARRNRARHSHE